MYGWTQDSQQSTNPDLLDNNQLNLNLPQLNSGMQNTSQPNANANNAYLWQNGLDHQAYIQQVQDNNAVVYQGGGDENVMFLNQSGNNNTAVVVQHGSNNLAEQTIEGNNNKSAIVQFGDNNEIHQEFYTDDLRYFITQWGNDNKVISYENNAASNGKQQQLGVIQRGDGIKIEIINGSNMPFGTPTTTQGN